MAYEELSLLLPLCPRHRSLVSCLYSVVSVLVIVVLVWVLDHNTVDTGTHWDLHDPPVKDASSRDVICVKNRRELALVMYIVRPIYRARLVVFKNVLLFD